MARAVLDTSALLAYVNGETGADEVAALIGDAIVSAVNFAEAVTKLVDKGGSLEQARAALGVADLDVVDFSRVLAELTGALVTSTRSKGLSLGDRACLALAQREKLPAVTADRAWVGVDVGVEVRLIR
jgi:PIN domain nuclease of toxin-antitoxin system